MTILHSSEYDQLLRFGQYFIGHEIPEFLNGWSRYVINKDLLLACHPQLEVLQEVRKGFNVTLIGYLIDPLHPSYDNKAVLNELIADEKFSRVPFVSTDRFGGRWIIIVHNTDDTILFADPAGLRQIYYTHLGSDDAIRCSCEPGLLAITCNLHMNEDSLAFQNSLGCQETSEYWWPGTITPFSSITRLLPNHYLSLKACKAVRFWPHEDIVSSSIEDVLHLIAQRLPALMSAILKRGTVTASLTAGWDSRMILAACREITTQLEFMTVQQCGMQRNHADLVIPRLLSQQLGFRHKVIDEAKKEDVRQSFRQAYRDSIILYHEKWLPDAQTIFDSYQHSTIVVVGSMAETGRLFYDWAFSDNKEITPETLAKTTKLGNHPYTLMAFNHWLESIQDVKGYSLADIFYWEQRAGRWLATSQLEFGMVWKDIFAPFNNRELLTAMLSVDSSARRGPDYPFFRMLIEEMWQKALSAPINPHQVAGKQSFTRRLIRRAKRMIDNVRL